MFRAARFLAFFLALAALFAAPALAREEILQFDARVEVRPDASLIVTETIRVRAEGAQIRHGIYRDFPLRFRYEDGATGKVGFEVLSVERDGKKENWFRKSMNNYARIYIGEKETLVPPGAHVYVLKYRTTRQIRYFRDYDELYWNVTGNFWRFPILKARAEVRLPGAARILKSALYTGPQGARGPGRAQVVRSEPGLFIAQTTAPLNAREGFTLAISFPKGVVAEPTAAEKTLRRFLDQIGLWWLLGGSFAVGGYFLWAWRKVGRDPAGGAIYPRWEPPAGLSPAGTAFLEGETRVFGMDARRAFIAALVSLATKGYLRIEGKEGKKEKTRLTRLKPADEALPPEERAVMERLFAASDDFVMERGNHKSLQRATTGLKNALVGKYKGVFVLRNRTWFFIGAGLAALVVLGFFLLGGAEQESVGPAMVTLFVGVFILFWGWQILRLYRRFGAGGRFFLIILVLFAGGPLLFLALSMTAGLAFPGGGAGISRAGLLTAAGLLGLPLLVMGFWFLLPRPTGSGRRALDEMEGLKLYLKTAEAERLNMPGAPRMSISTFERFLPYAIALGLEEPWTKAFQAWLASAMAAGAATAYQPTWYGGRSFSGEDAGDLGAGLVSGISADMARAMPTQSASGSSGGGFSGGGGGGGGGGGW